MLCNASVFEKSCDSCMRSHACTDTIETPGPPESRAGVEVNILRETASVLLQKLERPAFVESRTSAHSIAIGCDELSFAVLSGYSFAEGGGVALRAAIAWS